MIVALRFKIGAPRRSMRCRLCIGKCFPVVKGNLQLGVLAVEIMFKTVQIASALPFAHWHVVKQVVATRLRGCGGHLGLCKDPPQTSDGEATHVFYGICSRHNDLHACEATHGPHIHDVVLHFGIAEPSSHQVF